MTSFLGYIRFLQCHIKSLIRYHQFVRDYTKDILHINKTRQSITQHFIYSKNSIFCQGDMFRPYKVKFYPNKNL